MYEFFEKTRVKSPQYRFGTERRGYFKKNEFPGPGYYHIYCAIVDINDYTREQGNFNPLLRYI